MVSTRAGLVHYFEGVVAINGEPLKEQFGRFPEVGEGAEMRTGQGHAEVLMGPGVMLRVAEDSDVKLLSAALANVRVELVTGSAILESKDALAGNNVTIFYKDWQVKVSRKGVYRIDSSPEQIRVYDGEVEVSAKNGTPVTAKAGQTLPLALVLVPDQTLGPPGDAFNEWAFQRSQAIEADNNTAAQIVDDPALYPSFGDPSGLVMAGYTYFPPTLGYPYMGYNMYGPGVYSRYLTSYGVYGYPYMGVPVYGGYGAYGARGLSPLPIFPGRTGLPALPVRPPTSGTTIGGYGHPTGYRPPLGVGGGYRPPVSAPIATRPGLGAPAAPRPAAGPAMHGGRH